MVGWRDGGMAGRKARQDASTPGRGAETDARTGGSPGRGHSSDGRSCRESRKHRTPRLPFGPRVDPISTQAYLGS